ncbi:hypothetical protein B0H11DRAFT_1941462 [Mycena galericulata]|nr:hypothetical protein B0H11DRAFT_1941462 [Mycena galericulata]
MSFTELQICAAITQEKHREKYIELGKQNNWPQMIDYNTVHTQMSCKLPSSGTILSAASMGTFSHSPTRHPNSHLPMHCTDVDADNLHRKNIRAMSNANNPFFSQPPRYRKPAFLGLEIEKKPLAFEDKQEVPQNNNGKNKLAGKAKIPKRKKASQDNDVPTAGGYRTRSKSKNKCKSE